MSHEQQPQRWRIGDVTVTKIVDSVEPLDLVQTFVGATAEAISALPWLYPHFMTPEGQGLSSFHALVIEAPGRRIIVDTCIGNDKDLGPLAHWSDRQTTFLRNLESAGFPPESIDVVMCTHLHVDHVGWNTILVDDRWVPTFPKARYLMDRTEFNYWRDSSGTDDDSFFGKVQTLVFRDSVKPVYEAGLVDLVEGSYSICDEVSLVPTPGHSIGHMSVRIVSRGEEAIITGDVTHHPCQLAHPEWGISVDYDYDQAQATREAFFADSADRSVLVIGTHWAGVTAGLISREGRAYRFG